MIGIVVGLAAELKLARSLGGVIRVGNGTSPGAQRAVDELVESGVTALLSFGVAGGLAPGLVAGTIIVPRSVLTMDGEIACDINLVHRLGGPSDGYILGHGAIAATVAEKARLYAESGAIALDLESGVVAMNAVAERLPFAVLRVICDPAHRTLPHAALAALDEQGRIKLLSVLAALARRPGELISTVGLVLDVMAARRGLAHHVRAVSNCLKQ